MIYKMAMIVLVCSVFIWVVVGLFVDNLEPIWGRIGIVVRSDNTINIDEEGITITGVCDICEPINDGKLHFCPGHNEDNSSIE